MIIVDARELHSHYTVLPISGTFTFSLMQATPFFHSLDLLHLVICQTIHRFTPFKSTKVVRYSDPHWIHMFVFLNINFTSIWRVLYCSHKNCVKQTCSLQLWNFPQTKLVNLQASSTATSTSRWSRSRPVPIFQNRVTGFESKPSNAKNHLKVDNAAGGQQGSYPVHLSTCLGKNKNGKILCVVMIWS